MLGITRGRCFSHTSVLKNLPAAQETPESGRSPGEGRGTPLQHPCLEDLMITEAWWAAVNGAAKSRAQLSD